MAGPSLVIGPGYKPPGAPDFTYYAATDSGLPYDIASFENVHFAIATGRIADKNIVWDLKGRNLLVLRGLKAEDHLSIINANRLISFGNVEARHTKLVARYIAFLNSDLLTDSLQTPISVTKVSLHPTYCDSFLATCDERKNLTLTEIALLYGLITQGILQAKLDIISTKTFFTCPLVPVGPRGGAGAAETPVEALSSLERIKGGTSFYQESTPLPHSDRFLTLQQAVEYMRGYRYERSKEAPFELCSFGPIAVAVIKQPLIDNKKYEWDAEGNTLLFLSPIRSPSLVIRNAKAVIFCSTVQVEHFFVEAERTLFFNGGIYSSDNTSRTLLIEQPLDPRLVPGVVKALESAITKPSPSSLLKALTSLLRLYSNLTKWPSTEIFHALAFLHDPPFATEDIRPTVEGGGGAAAAAAAALPPGLASASLVTLGEGVEALLELTSTHARSTEGPLLTLNDIVEIIFPLVGEVRFYGDSSKLPPMKDGLDLKGSDLVILTDLMAPEIPIRIRNARRVIIFGTVLTPSLQIMASSIHVINGLVLSREVKGSITEVSIPTEAASLILQNCRSALETRNADEALEAVAQVFDTVSYCERGFVEMSWLSAHLKASHIARVSSRTSGGFASWLSPFTSAVTTAWGHFTKGLEEAGMKDVLRAAQGEKTVGEAFDGVVTEIVGDGEDLVVIHNDATKKTSPHS